MWFGKRNCDWEVDQWVKKHLMHSPGSTCQDQELLTRRKNKTDSISVSVPLKMFDPRKKKLRVWMVWNEGMWGRALVLGRAYIMKNLLTTTTIAARGKVNFSWPKWHRLSDRLICVFSLCVLLESLMLELILKSDLETFLCQRADHPILIFKSRNSLSVFSVLAPAYFEEERTDNAFNSSEDD